MLEVISVTSSPIIEAISSTLPRRRLLASGVALALAPASELLGASPAAAESVDQGVDFVFVSHFLTGHAELDPALGRGILAAFTALDPAFPQKATRLRAFIQEGRLAPEALQAALDAAASPVASVPRQIVRAWYVGVVGNGAEARCITYTGALMHIAVADVLQPPSYAHGQYGSWASKPL